jgi:catechol 2,3-dioxygenase-like lactoylglutathione lyase family enzyme
MSSRCRFWVLNSYLGERGRHKPVHRHTANRSESPASVCLAATALAAPVEPRARGRQTAPAWDAGRVTPEDLAHLRRARHLMNHAHAQALDVPALARTAFMSPAHFSRQLRAAYDETPYGYLLTRRIDMNFEGMRWLTVGPAAQPDIEIVLEPGHARAGRPGTAQGAAGQGCLEHPHLVTDDCDATLEQLRAAGAEVLQEPIDQPYGVRDCAFRDPLGTNSASPSAAPADPSRCWSQAPPDAGGVRIGANNCRIGANNCRIGANKCRIASSGPLGLERSEGGRVGGRKAG